MRTGGAWARSFVAPTLAAAVEPSSRRVRTSAERHRRSRDDTRLMAGAAREPPRRRAPRTPRGSGCNARARDGVSASRRAAHSESRTRDKRTPLGRAAGSSRTYATPAAPRSARTRHPTRSVAAARLSLKYRCHQGYAPKITRLAKVAPRPRSPRSPMDTRRKDCLGSQTLDELERARVAHSRRRTLRRCLGRKPKSSSSRLMSIRDGSS